MSQDPVQLVGEIKATMEKMKETNAQINADLKKSVEASGAEAKEAINAANKAAGEMQKMSASILELEQKLSDGVIKGKASVETLGNSVIKSEAFKQFAAGNTNKFRIEANTITGQSGSPAENNDTLTQTQRVAGIIPGAFRTLKIRDLAPNFVTTSNAVEYTRELLFTNGAAETAEGATKPEATLTFELASANVRTIAHWLKLSKQVLDDAPALAGYVDNRLRYGVELKYDSQLLNGAGTSQTILGMTASANRTAFTPTTGETQLDSINRMIEAAQVAEYEATAIVLNPVDWHKIERIKEGTSYNTYALSNPAQAVMPMLWGKPVVVTNALTAGKCLVAAFDIAYGIWNRMGTVVEMFEQDDTNVQKNLVTVRAELRGCLTGFRPASAFYGDLTI
jgi:HK97 family phage major capsid protein